MRTVTCLMLGVSALAVAGCTNLPGADLGETFTAESYLNGTHGGDDFNGYLASEYTGVAKRAAGDVQWLNSTAYIAKAKQAEAGNTPAPWAPSEVGIKRPGPRWESVENAETLALYDDVVTAVDANKNVNPAACARTQAMWDQYLELLRAEAAGDPPRMTAAEARALLDEALAACAPPPGPKKFTVYFGFDLTNLTDVAKATLNEVVAAVDEMGTTALSVVGHTDTMGSVQYNQGLSERRADSVAGNLAAHGIPANEMTLAGRSELEPAVVTGDNVREPLNRRVEITLGN